MERLIQKYANKSELIDALNGDIKTWIERAIESRGHCTILLSGGSTPKALYEKIAEENIDFSKVSIGLVDERFVGITDPNSNEAMIRSALGKAVGLEITGMIHPHSDLVDIAENTQLIQESYQKYLNADIVLLGMGEDGHFASLFPNDYNSQSGLEENTSAVIHTLAPGHPRQRISCNLAFIKTAKKCILMITGTSKLSKLEASGQELTPIHFIHEYLDCIYFSE